eukprot:evm.model.scf_1431.2 EVM.evm.TU.scf_1431.2   scf_1431:20192-22283(+)
MEQGPHCKRLLEVVRQIAAFRRAQPSGPQNATPPEPLGPPILSLLEELVSTALCRPAFSVEEFVLLKQGLKVAAGAMASHPAAADARPGLVRRVAGLVCSMVIRADDPALGLVGGGLLAGFSARMPSALASLAEFPGAMAALLDQGPPVAEAAICTLRGVLAHACGLRFTRCGAVVEAAEEHRGDAWPAPMRALLASGGVGRQLHGILDTFSVRDAADVDALGRVVSLLSMLLHRAARPQPGALADLELSGVGLLRSVVRAAQTAIQARSSRLLTCCNDLLQRMCASEPSLAAQLADTVFEPSLDFGEGRGPESGDGAAYAALFWMNAFGFAICQGPGVTQQRIMDWMSKHHILGRITAIMRDLDPLEDLNWFLLSGQVCTGVLIPVLVKLSVTEGQRSLQDDLRREGLLDVNQHLLDTLLTLFLGTYDEDILADQEFLGHLEGVLYVFCNLFFLQFLATHANPAALRDAIGQGSMRTVRDTLRMFPDMFRVSDSDFLGLAARAQDEALAMLCSILRSIPPTEVLVADGWQTQEMSSLILEQLGRFCGVPGLPVVLQASVLRKQLEALFCIRNARCDPRVKEEAEQVASAPNALHVLSEVGQKMEELELATEAQGRFSLGQCVREIKEYQKALVQLHNPRNTGPSAHMQG